VTVDANHTNNIWARLLSVDRLKAKRTRF